MKCWKCGEEMHCVNDTNWTKRHDGEVWRLSDFICVECRTYLTIEASDYSECDIEDE